MTARQRAAHRAVATRRMREKEAINRFLDANASIADEYVNDTCPAWYDSVNEVLELRGARRVATLRDAVAACLGPAGARLTGLKIDVLNETTPARFNRVGRCFRLPDEVIDVLCDQLERAREANGATIGSEAQATWED